jgi:O-antigen/teichoic acid export membrane protein
VNLRRNVIANFVGQGWSSVMTLAFVPLYIRYLGIEAYALVGMFAVIQIWLSLLDLGMTPTLSREMARFTAGAMSPQAIRNLLRSFETIALGLAIAIALVIFGASGWLAHHWLRVEKLSTVTVAHALALIGVVVALRFCEGLYRSAIIGLQQQVWLNGASIAFATFRSGGAALMLALLAPTIDVFFIWQGIASLLTLIAYGYKVHICLPPAPAPARFSPAALVEVRRFTGGMMGIALLSILLTQVDKLLLARLLPLHELGYYLLAASMTGLIYVAVGPITQAYYPAFVRLFANGEAEPLAASYHTAAQLVSTVLTPTALVMVLYAHPLILAWSGSTDLAANAAPIVALLAIGTWLNAVMHIPYQLQLAHGWTSLSLRMNIVAVAVLMPALIWVVPHYGVVGAAAIWALLNGFYVLVTIPLQHRRILPSAMWAWYGRDVALPLIGAAVPLLALLPLAHILPATRLSSLVLVAFAGVLGIAGAGLAADRVRGPVFDKLRTQLRRARPV